MAAYYRFPSVPLWVLTFFLLVLPRVNRKPQAWLILIPLGVAMIAREVLVRTMFLPASSEVTFDFFVVTGAVSWAAVWLLGHWLAACRRIPAILLALAIPAAIALLSISAISGLRSRRILIGWRQSTGLVLYAWCRRRQLPDFRAGGTIGPGGCCFGLASG